MVAHAESIKTIETLKKQLSTIQTAAREYQTLAETAGAKLTASEDSWKHQKEALDKEVADLSTRYVRHYIVTDQPFNFNRTDVKISPRKTLYSINTSNQSALRPLASARQPILLSLLRVRAKQVMIPTPNCPSCAPLLRISARRRRSSIYSWN